MKRKNTKTVKEVLVDCRPSLASDRIHITLTPEVLAFWGYLAYFVGHSPRRIDPSVRAQALKIAMDAHKIIRKRDESLGDFLDQEADRLRQYKKKAEEGLV